MFIAASGDDEEDNWQYLAHYRSHYKQITGIIQCAIIIAYVLWGGGDIQTNFSSGFPILEFGR